MIKCKQKFETPNFIFWLTEYESGSLYQYDMVMSSENVSPSATKEELGNLADFIKKFVEDHQ
jgi:hypothetical protein